MPPYSVSSARIDGAEYQTSSRHSARKPPSLAGSLPSASPTRTTVPPTAHEAKRSNTERSKWNGACDPKRSPTRRSNVVKHQLRKQPALACVSMTPLGLPVDPDV